MKYIYSSPQFDQKMCDIFEVEYVPSEITRIEIEKIKSHLEKDAYEVEKSIESYYPD